LPLFETCQCRRLFKNLKNGRWNDTFTLHSSSILVFLLACLATEQRHDEPGFVGRIIFEEKVAIAWAYNQRNQVLGKFGYTIGGGLNAQTAGPSILQGY